MRLYKRDTKTKGFFFLSGFSCITYLIFSILDFSNTSTKVVLSIFLFAVNLDSLVFYVFHVCHLLDPNSACDIAIKEAKRLIDKIQNTIPRYTKEQLQGEIPTKEKASELEREFYARLPEHQEWVLRYIEGMAEIAYKAATKNDNITAKVAINSVVEVTKYYLEKRNDNTNYEIGFFRVFPSISSDLDSFLCRVFENLMRINNAALKNDNEQIVVDVLAAYAAIGFASVSPYSLHFFMQCAQKSL